MRWELSLGKNMHDVTRYWCRRPNLPVKTLANRSSRMMRCPKAKRVRSRSRLHVHLVCVKASSWFERRAEHVVALQSGEIRCICCNNNSPSMARTQLAVGLLLCVALAFAHPGRAEEAEAVVTVTDGDSFDKLIKVRHLHAAHWQVPQKCVKSPATHAQWGVIHRRNMLAQQPG